MFYRLYPRLAALLPPTRPGRCIRLAAVERALARDPKTLPKVQRERRGGNGSAATVELLKVLLRQVSEESHVAGKLIATVDELEAIAADDNADVAALKGGRASCLERGRSRAKAGRLALTVQRGKVITLEWQDAEAPQEGVADGA